MHNFLKRIEIRLNRSEVTNYLSSIHRTPALQPEGTVSIKAEPINEEEMSFMMETESPHNSEHEDLSSQSQVQGFTCTTCHLTFKYHLHLKHHHQSTNQRCNVLYYPKYDIKIDADPESSNLNGPEDALSITIKAEPLHTPDSEVGVQRKGFQCPTCQLTFKYRLHLRHHLNTNSRCTVQCIQTNDVKLDKNWKTEDTDTHTSNSNAQLKHSCPKCKKKFSRSEHLRRHMAVHMENPHGRMPYVCSTCRQGFKHEINFKCHTQKEHSFKCEHCELAFPYKSNLDGHTTKRHRDRITNMGQSVGIKDSKCETAVSRRMLPCPECKKEFARYSGLVRHMKYIHSNERPYVCSKCLQTFKVQHELNRHIQKDHIFKCVNCDLSFRKRTSVEAHVQKCHPEETMSKGYNIVGNNVKTNGTTVSVFPPKHSCPQCKKELASSTTLQHHITHVHSNERPYRCSTCLRTFKLSAHRDDHARKEHKFKCENCELSFLTKFGLEEHAVKYHQAVSQKCFSCPECEKKFKKNVQLRAHMRVHGTERPYVCSTCLLTFKYEHNLIGHTRKNHVFKCGKCSLVFSCQIHLTQHLSQHTTEKEVI